MSIPFLFLPLALLSVVGTIVYAINRGANIKAFCKLPFVEFSLEAHKPKSRERKDGGPISTASLTGTSADANGSR